eukprot:TRINITY_DN48596_c0_g1_i1.p1 TRINITY_DN48596_c0_g1~~TRINITY_DN48596_c0_g1_i1.p1  ORF type:complete len:187 (+),score=49.63 TRINITY_DN48596_c0_g1_i1:76-561(+)
MRAVALCALAAAAAAAEPQPGGGSGEGDPYPRPKDGRGVLSEHEVIAIFDGVVAQQRPGGAPERRVAWFSVERYLHHALRGEHGDPRQKRYALTIDEAEDDPQPQWARDKALELQPGQRVRLRWRHEYVRHVTGTPEDPVELFQPERRVTVLKEVGSIDEL